MRKPAALLCVLVLAGCGESSPAPATAPGPTATARSISVEEIEALADARAAAAAQARRNERLERQAELAPTPAAAVTPAAPAIEPAYIPFPAQRKQEMAAYAQRHYGLNTYRLSDPRVVVVHFTATADAAGAIDLFRPDTPDPELGELPNVCTHYVIDTDGAILAVVPVEIMCRHTVGLNHTAIGIEHAGFSAEDVLGNEAMMESSLALTRWLQCTHGIADADVIGHNESLSSPYHRENVPELRTQTHDDFNADEMGDYRDRLAAQPGC